MYERYVDWQNGVYSADQIRQKPHSALRYIPGSFTALPSSSPFNLIFNFVNPSQFKGE